MTRDDVHLAPSIDFACGTDEVLAPSMIGQARSMCFAAFDADDPEEAFSDDDWDHTCGGWRVIALAGDTVIGHAAVVERHITVGGTPWRTGYVEGVAVAHEWRGRGVGLQLMRAVNDHIRAACDFGALGTGVQPFYERTGWERWLGPTWIDFGTHRERSPSEDGWVMALRFGATRDLDLAADITCPTRRGDDW